MKKPAVINEPKERLSVTLEEHIKINQGLNRETLQGEINVPTPAPARN